MTLTRSRLDAIEARLGVTLEAIEVTTYGNREPVFYVAALRLCDYCQREAIATCATCGAPPPRVRR